MFRCAVKQSSCKTSAAKALDFHRKMPRLAIYRPKSFENCSVSEARWRSCAAN